MMMTTAKMRRVNLCVSCQAVRLKLLTRQMQSKLFLGRLMVLNLVLLPNQMHPCCVVLAAINVILFFPLV